MSEVTSATSQETPTPVAKDISDPEISFTDYERMRSEGKTTESASDESAPAEEAEQKKGSTESGAEEQEAKEEERDDESSEDESEESDEDKEEKSEKEKPRKKNGFKERIDKLRARETRARQELEYWKQEALKRGADKTQETEKPQTKAEASDKPSADDFETHAEYIDALTDWKIEQRDKAREAEQQKNQLMSEQEKLIKAHHEREKSFAEKTPDYAELITDLLESNPKVSAAFEAEILESENGPELMYELAKNPEEFERLNKLPPRAVARELGRIETRLASQTSEKPKAEPKKTTKAPKPIEPVSGGKGAVAKSIDDPNISFAEYERIRSEQLKRKGSW